MLLQLTILTAVVLGQGDEDIVLGGDTLAGHERIVVGVQMQDAGKDLGLRKDTLESYVVDRLKKSGFDAANKADGQTLFLDFEVNILKVEAGGATVYVYSLEASAAQAVMLTNRKITKGVTWKTGTFGLLGERGAKLVKTSVDDALDQFIAALKAANEPPDDPFERP